MKKLAIWMSSASLSAAAFADAAPAQPQPATPAPLGADGDAVHYVGGWTGAKMEFRAEDVSSPQMTKVVLTMTFEPLADGSVRQSGTQSTDGGKTFQPAWDLTYRKAK